MKSEIEATFLDVNHNTLRKKLKALHAKLMGPEILTRRTIFDYPDLRLDKTAAWVRVRDDGSKTTVCYKQRQSETVDGMKEIEFEASSYANAKQFLQSIGLTVKAEQESKREVWQYKDCEIMLDTWPWIPPFIEIEGPSEESVKHCSTDLGFDWSEVLFDSIDAIYMKHFNVTRTEISSIPIRFGELPKFLVERKK